MVEFQHDIEQCLEMLKKGGTILYPTDTLWGIGCDATNPEAVDKIFKLKKRPREKAMIVLVAEENEIKKHVASLDLRVFEYLQEVTKPTTVIYKGAIGLAENLVAKDGSIAIRICNELFCKHLIKRFRRPIVSTSANFSGQPAVNSFSTIPDDIKLGVDYIVKYRQDEETITEPSSVIKWNKDGTVTVLRA